MTIKHFFHNYFKRPWDIFWDIRHIETTVDIQFNSEKDFEAFRQRIKKGVLVLQMWNEFGQLRNRVDFKFMGFQERNETWKDKKLPFEFKKNK